MKKLRIENILVPIDFSELSVGAISMAQNLAQRFGATVHLAYVQEPLYPIMFYGMGAPAPIALGDTIEDIRKRSEVRLKTLANEYRITGTTQSVLGAPVFDEICLIARRLPTDLIVTPTHGRTGFDHLLLGSTAERLIQHAPCPVWVTRASKQSRSRKTSRSGKPIDTILVPVDFSDASLEGLRYAAQFADRFAAKIIVLNVVDIGPALGSDGFDSYDLSRYNDLARAQAEKRMPLFLRSAKLSGAKIETRVVIGRSADSICAAAKQYNVDAIVIATHGRTGLRHVLIGSTAEVVVRHALCPVLVIPSHPLERRKKLETKAKPARLTNRPRVIAGALKQMPLEKERFTKRFRKTRVRPFPERRKTNKFRESHAG